MFINNCDLHIRINGRAIPEYSHELATYVEGRAGSEYELAFTNHNRCRVEVVLSVDGLSVTDGKPAGDHSTGYVVEAGASVRIPGWKVDAATAARFAFTSQKPSYAAEMTGKADNNGVVGALVFGERPRLAVPFYQGYSTTGLHNGLLYNAVATSATMTSSAAQALEPTQNGVRHLPPLGTAFGPATEFATTAVAFSRGDRLATLVMFYDERSGLVRRGVPMTRHNRPYSRQSAPQAFPGLSCAPPPGWQR